MITRPLIIVYLDRVEIDQRHLEDVTIFNSIDMTLPELTFKINDTDGDYLSKLNVYEGATVGIEIIEGNRNLEKDSLTAKTLCDFVITKIFDGFEFGNEQMGGFIQVWCKPSWYLLGNYQGHAYAPMKLSALIKKVCEDANPNIRLKIEDERFTDSSDPGNTPRFKCGESDLEFIEQKLLPYTNIQDSNVFFFLDWYNRPNLTSFAKMVSAEPKVIIYPAIGIADTVQDKITKIVEQKGITEYYSWERIQVKIGDEDLKKAFATMKKKISLENNETGKVYIANQQPKARMGKDSDKAKLAKMPFNAMTMEYIEATSNEAYPNRLLPDALAMARNSDNDVIDFIELTIYLKGVVDGFTCGDTLLLLTPLRRVRVNKDDEAKSIADEINKKNTHWLNGKWLIKSVLMQQEKCNPDECTTVLHIARPTLVYNVDTTTIDKSNYLYSVD